MSARPGSPDPDWDGLAVNVVELNTYAPRPFVFTDLARCLRDAIRLAGYRSEHLVNEPDPAGVSIVMGAGPAHLAVLDRVDPARCVIANFEQIASASSMAGPDYLAFLRDRMVVDYHSRNVDNLRLLNGETQQVCELPVMPGTSAFYRPELEIEPSVDVLFFGTPCARRDQLVQQLQAAGLSTEVVAGAYGPELVPAVCRARMVVHAHFYETGLFPVARFLQPLAHGLPIVCENSEFSALSDWSRSGIRFAAYDELVTACIGLLASPAEQLEQARRTRRFIASLDFATPFAALLQAVSARGARARVIRAAPPELLTAPVLLSPPASPVQATPAPAEPGLDGLDLTALPPESHLPGPPLEMATRKPGEGPYGRWIAWALIIFSVLTILQYMRNSM